MNLNKVSVIAEVGVNHNGKISYAKKLILVAKKAGADYVKFQTFKADNLVQKKSKLATYQKNNTNLKSQYHTISAVVEFQLGLRWETKFSNDDYRIRLQASWEEQVYFNQNQFIILGKAPYYGNLCMQGLNIEARLDF